MIYTLSTTANFLNQVFPQSCRQCRGQGRGSRITIHDSRPCINYHVSLGCVTRARVKIKPPKSNVKWVSVGPSFGELFTESTGRTLYFGESELLPLRQESAFMQRARQRPVISQGAIKVFHTPGPGLVRSSKDENAFPFPDKRSPSRLFNNRVADSGEDTVLKTSLSPPLGTPSGHVVARQVNRKCATPNIYGSITAFQ
jgi:hypothetical protein